MFSVRPSISVFLSRAPLVRFSNQTKSAKTSSMMDGDRPVESTVRRKLTEKLNPLHLDVINESYLHNVPKGQESHFKVVVVSEAFNGKPLIQRHRMVNEILADEIENNIHALSIETKTPEQWDKSSKTVSPSPPCQGGFGR